MHWAVKKGLMYHFPQLINTTVLWHKHNSFMAGERSCGQPEPQKKGVYFLKIDGQSVLSSQTSRNGKCNLT